MEISKIALLYNIQQSRVLSKLQDYHIAWIKEIVPEAQIIYAEDEAQLLKLTDDADILVTSRILPAENFCQKAKSLKWVHNLYAGMDIIMKSKTIKSLY